MGRDLTPYRIQRWQINWEKGNVAGPASKVLEIPVSWYLDDFRRSRQHRRRAGRPSRYRRRVRRWRDIFDCAHERVDSPVYPMAVHPQVIGQAHHIMAYEKLIEHIMSKEESGSPLASRLPRHGWMMRMTKRKMALPDVRVCRPLQRTHHLARNPLRPNSPSQ